MSDNMNLVAHVRRTEKGLTKMQIRLPLWASPEPVWLS